MSGERSQKKLEAEQHVGIKPIARRVRFIKMCHSNAPSPLTTPDQFRALFKFLCPLMDSMECVRPLQDVHGV
eukprot:361082-Chlamydomonas_euryale.AAC.10